MAIEEELASKALGWFKELVRVDSSNPPGREREVVAVAARILSENGIKPLIIEKRDGRSNLFAEIAGPSAASAPPLLLSSHVDVVPAAGSEVWKHPPFSAEEAEGCIWGRGTLDVKYKTAFDLAALITAKKTGVTRGLKMLALADEEASTEAGSAFVIAEHRALIDAQYVFNEIGGFTYYIAGAPLLLFQSGEKGRLLVEIVATAPSGHASMPGELNAITLVSKAIAVLEGKTFGYRCSRSSGEFLAALAQFLPPQAAGLFKMLGQQATFKQALGQLPDAALAAAVGPMFYATLCPTKIEGGLKENVAPDSAAVLLDARLVPGTQPEEIIDELRRMLHEGLGKETLSHIEVRYRSWAPGYEIDPADPLFASVCRTLRDFWRKDLPALQSAPILMPASSDSSNYARAGITPIGLAPLLFPEGFPGFSLAHGANERVPVEAFEKGLLGYLEVVKVLTT